MLWRRPAPQLTPSSAPVPDADRLRLAVLQASWSRGRWVARRRVAVRWVLWVLGRYVMPALAVSGVAAWLWLGVLQDIDSPLDRLAQWSGWPAATEAAPAQAPMAAPVTSTAADVPTLPVELATHSPEGEWIEYPPQLKLEPRWAGASLLAAAAPATGANSPETDPPPTLKPENWLHSKEP